MDRLKKLLQTQKEFQLLCDIAIDGINEQDKCLLSEFYIFKAIEELVELRKTHPSALNKSAKFQPKINRANLLGEYSDVLLFLINIAIVWEISPDEIMENLLLVQQNNFRKKLEKMNLDYQEKFNKFTQLEVTENE